MPHTMQQIPIHLTKPTCSCKNNIAANGTRIYETLPAGMAMLKSTLYKITIQIKKFKAKMSTPAQTKNEEELSKPFFISNWAIESTTSHNTISENIFNVRRLFFMRVLSPLLSLNPGRNSQISEIGI